MKDNKNMWNQAANEYYKVQEESRFVEVNKRIVKERFNAFKGKVLDYGCGYGFYTNYFKEIGADVIGCDISDVMINKSKSLYRDIDFYIIEENKTLPFESEDFDLVFVNQVLMDIENLDFVIKETARVLKKDGLFYCAILHPVFYNAKWLKNGNDELNLRVVEKYLSEYKIVNNFWGKTNHYHRTISTYINVFISSGFEISQVYEPQTYFKEKKSAEFPLFFIIECLKK